MKYEVGAKVQLIKDANQGQVKAGEIGEIIDYNGRSIDMLTGIVTIAGFTVDFTNAKNVFFTDLVIDEYLVICEEVQEAKQNKIIDYVIMADADEDYLRTMVKGALDEEWSLYGFPFASEGYFCQAMVKHKNNKEVCHYSKRFLVGQWVKLKNHLCEASKTGDFGLIVNPSFTQGWNRQCLEEQQYLVEIPGHKTPNNDYYWWAEEKQINLL